MVGLDPVTAAVAIVASSFMAWTIGAGSSGSTPFAPAVGANAISVMRAGFFVGLLGFAGATLQGANVSEAVGRELVRGVTITAEGATAGLLIAAALVGVGVYTGYPIATAFTVTGAVIGGGLALGGAPAWAKYRQIAALWALTPFVGGGAAFAMVRGLRREGVPASVAVPALGALVGGVVANVRFDAIGPAGGSVAAVAGRAVPVAPPLGRLVVTGLVALGAALVLHLDLRGDPARGRRHLLLVLGGLVAFSAGGSQVGLAIGPLLPLVDRGGVAATVPFWAVLAFGGVGLLAGSWMGAPRLIKALSQDYSSLTPRRSIAALVPSFVIAQVAVSFGIPVSFNEIVVSAIVGSGAAAGEAGVGRTKVLYTVGAWIASFVLAVGIAYAVVAIAG